MKNFTKLLLIVSLFVKSSLIAQEADTIEIKRNSTGKVSFARFEADANRTIQNGGLFLKAVLSGKNNDEFRLMHETTDNLGFSHRLYAQYYKSIKVENAEYLVHGRNGIIEIINGNFEDINISSITPTFSEQEALKTAVDFVHAEKYKWQDTSMEKFIKERTGDPHSTYYPKGELVITKNFLKGGNNFRLAWKFGISSLFPNNEQWIYVDAITNEV